MSDTVPLIRRMPLDGAVISHDGLTIRPVPAVGKILLQRANGVDDKAVAALGKLFRLEMPMQVCRKAVSDDGAITLLCIGPDMWHILCAEERAWAFAADIEMAAGDATITAAVMTDQYICLDIEGRHARALLAKGCALDLDVEVFSEGQVAPTVLAQANIVLWRRRDRGFRLLFDVSLRDYLWRWLEGAATEFSAGHRR